MNAEIVRRTNDGLTVWRGKDAEGRVRYGVTADNREGVAVEPSKLPWTNPNNALGDARRALEAA